jgi:hypothetical protein
MFYGTAGAQPPATKTDLHSDTSHDHIICSPNQSVSRRANETDTTTAETKFCNSLSLVRKDTFPSSIEDFRIKNDTKLTQVATRDSLHYFMNNSIETSVKLDSKTRAYLNRGQSPWVATCKDHSDNIRKTSEKSLECFFYDDQGTRRSSRWFPQNAAGHALVDGKFTVSEGGKFAVYKINRDTPIWKTDEIIDSVSIGPKHRFVLITFSGLSGTRNELRQLTSGEQISYNEKFAFDQGVSQGGKYLYQISTNPGSHSRTLTIYNRRFELLAEWSKLPFKKVLGGIFELKRDRILFFPSPDYFYAGNYNQGREDTVPYPGESFHTEAYAHDPENDHLFILGTRGMRPLTAVFSKRYSRYLIVFDLEENRFLPVSYRFSKDHYDYASNEDPELRLLGKNRLAIKHPKRLEIFEYDFGQRK